MSTYSISLFGESPVEEDSAFAVFLSALMHTMLIALTYTGLTYVPVVVVVSSISQSQVHFLQMDNPVLPSTRDRAKVDLSFLHPAAAHGNRTQNPDAQRSDLQQKKGGRIFTAAQADAPVQRISETAVPLSAEIPLPTFLLWSSPPSNARLMVPPKPHPQSLPAVQPRVALPNNEVQIAEVNLTSSNLPSRSIIPSGTTIPVAGSDPQQDVKAPETSNISPQPPKGGRAFSISDIRMTHGPVPIAGERKSETASSSGSSTVAGTSIVDGNTGAKMNSEQKTDGDSAESPAQTAAQTATIRNPGNGSFRIIVVGASLEDMYPGTENSWSGRLAYTVYLDVGLPEKWILQYAHRRGVDDAESASGAQLKAPWPLEMVVPRIEAKDQSPILVHGFINQHGRFEQLTLQSSSQSRWASFILNALQQWEFRPASTNGKASDVEILLVIP